MTFMQRILATSPTPVEATHRVVSLAATGLSSKDLAKPNSRTASHILKSLGFRAMVLDPGNTDPKKLVYLAKNQFAWSATTVVEILSQFYKEAGALKKVTKGVDSISLNLKFTPTSAVTVVFNNTGNANHPPSEIWFES